MSASLVGIVTLVWGCSHPALILTEVSTIEESGRVRRNGAHDGFRSGAEDDPVNGPQSGTEENARPGVPERWSSEARGPAPIRSQHPLVMIFLDFELRSASTQPAGQARLDTGITYTSMYQARESEDGRTVVSYDGEWAELALDFRYGISDRLEVFATLPFLYTTSGFLDSVVEDYHDAFSFNQDGRDLAPRDKFAVSLIHEGQTFYELEEDTFGIQDMPIGVAYAVLKEDATIPGLQIRGALELPTGKEEFGFGNGAIDAGLGFVVEKSLGIFTFILGGDYTWIQPTDAMKDAGVELNNLLGAFFNTEVRIGSKLSGLVGIDYLSQPLANMPLAENHRDQLLLVFGGAIQFGKNATLRLDFVEDLVRDVSPDFSGRLGIQIQF